MVVAAIFLSGCAGFAQMRRVREALETPQGEIILASNVHYLSDMVKLSHQYPTGGAIKMAIPKYDEMYRAFLDCRSDGQPHKSKEVKDNAARVFHVSDADRAALLPSGSAPVFDGRVGWTKTYLKKAGLIQSPSRGVYVLTAEGKQVLAENPNTIDNLYLQRFESFRKFISPDAQAVHSSTSSASSQTPQDVLEEAFQRINTTLADDLLPEIMKLSPSFLSIWL